MASRRRGASASGGDRTRPILVAVSASVLAHEQADCLRAGFAEFLGKHFRFERICECLATLLNVEFELGSPGGEAVRAGAEIDASGLPPEILRRAIAAAESHHSTELKAALRELAETGPEGARLAQGLEPFVREFDLEKVVSTLRRLRPGKIAEGEVDGRDAA